MSQESKIVDGRYTLTHLVGRGGVGEVWRAIQAPLNRSVALKLIRPEYAGDAQIRRRFAREARAASGLAHPNVAAVFDFGADENERLFMAMELIEGSSVSQAIESGLSVRNILEMADQLLGGLAHAHARGVVHRDLKPDNVVLSGANLPESIGIPKIVDFGIAAIIEKGEEHTEDTGPDPDNKTLRGEVIGTPRYMSPEQAMGERNLGPRTDLYNMGLIIYELITGERPFGDDKGLAVMSRHVHDRIPTIIPRDGLTLPDSFAELIMKALEKDPLDRYGSAAEMRAAFKPLLEASRELPDANIVPARLPVVAEVPTPVDNPARLESDDWSEVMEVSDEEIEWVQPWEVNLRTPFVGRTQERAILTSLVETVTNQGRGSILLLSGEAGVGKTRLTQWLKEYVEENGLMRANSGAFARGNFSSLRGVQDVLESMFRTRGLARAEVGAKIADRLNNWNHASPEDSAALTDFLRPSRQEDTRPTSVSTSSLFAMIARVMEVGARSKPRLILLDDIHWAGRELADFLEFFAIEMRHRNIPILLVGTIRTEDLNERPELATRLNGLSRYLGETVEKIELERFGATTGRNLVEALLPSDDSLAEVILERASGNPLHISFLLRYLRDVGLLQIRAGRWHAQDIEEVRKAVPPSLGDLFSVRIEQAETHYKIDGRLKRILQYAAVAGPRFQFDVLQRMVELGGETEIRKHFEYDLDRLVAEGFLSEVEGRGDDWYGFVHGLLRDYLLRGIRPLVTRSLHRNAAEAKADVYGKLADAEAMDIAGHWKAARNAEHALHWYQRAALTALRSFMLPQAAEAYQETLTIMDDLLGLQNHLGDPLLTALNRARFDEARVPVDDYLHSLSRLGDLHEGFGHFPRAEELYRRVVRIVGKDSHNVSEEGLSPLGYSWLGIGHIAWQRGDFEAAEWAFLKVRDLVADSPKHRKVDSHAARGLARVAWHRADYEAAATLAETARELSSLIDHQAGQAESIWLQGEIKRMTGKPEKARTLYVDSMEIYRTINDLTGLARNLLSLAQVARAQKEFEESGRLYLAALSHYEKLGDRRGAGMSHNGLGDIARWDHRYADADRHYGRAMDIYETIGADYYLAIVLANLGLNAIGLADMDAGEAYLQAALNMVPSGDFPYLVLGIEFNLALVNAFQGDQSGVNYALERLDDVKELNIADIDYARPMEELGLMLQAQGRKHAAQRLLQAAGQIYSDLGLESDAQRVAAH